MSDRNSSVRTARICVRIHPALKLDLSRLASQDSRTLSQYIEKLLEEHIAERDIDPAST